MRALVVAAALAAALTSAGCAETVRCPEGQVFDAEDECIPIPDAGPIDASGDVDAST